MMTPRRGGAIGTALAGELRRETFTRTGLRHTKAARKGVSARLLLALVGAVGCDDVCVFDEVQTVVSPDRNWQVVVFGRDCGPTVGNVVHINVLSASKKPTMGRGNTFRADSDYGKALVNALGTPLVQVTWTGPHVLTVTYDTRERVVKKVERVGDVSVRYVATTLKN
jgi:hypothetical protein